MRRKMDCETKRYKDDDIGEVHYEFDPSVNPARLSGCRCCREISEKRCCVVRCCALMLVDCGDAGRFEALQRKTRDLCCSESLKAQLNTPSNRHMPSFREFRSRHRTAKCETGKLESAREKVLTAAIHRAEPSSTVPENRRRRAVFCSHQSESASIQEGAQVVPSQAQSAKSRSNTRKSSNA